MVVPDSLVVHRRPRGGFGVEGLARCWTDLEKNYMATYAEYQKQILELQAKADEARKQEVNAARAQVVALMNTHGLTLADLVRHSPRKQRDTSQARKPVDIKFRDPVSGNTWTGRGRAPAWIVGKDRAGFEVQKSV